MNYQRKKTLLREYKERDKRNSVIDRRFGERDDTLSHDDKMTQRYILERKVIISHDNNMTPIYIGRKDNNIT